MSHEITQGADSLVMNDKDDVATVLREMKAGETIHYIKGARMGTVLLLDVIPFGHKAAIVAIEQGSDVYKYGDIIGRATRAIEPGQHVHVHNIEGIRGRGDLSQQHKGEQ